MNLRLALLASCIALPAYAASSFDGRQYHGTLSRDPGGYNAATCSQSANILMTVDNGMLQYNHFQKRGAEDHRGSGRQLHREGGKPL
jgi:hypothetical protein